MKIGAQCEGAKQLLKFYLELFGQKYEECNQCGCSGGCGASAPFLVDGDHRVNHLTSIIKYIGLKSQCPCYFNRDAKQQSLVDSALEGCVKRQQALCLFKRVTCPDNKDMFNAQFAQKCYDDIVDLLEKQNHCLEDKTYAVNERISIADFYIAFLTRKFMELFTQNDAKKFVCIVRHYNTIAANFPLFEKYFGKIQYAKNPVKIEACCGCKGAAAPAAAQASEKEAEKPAEKKISYSYKMDLDAWKRHYKNLDFEKDDWQDYFYKNFDGQDQSLWLLAYKDPSDFKVDWQTKNLFTILLQRIRGNKGEKHTFGNFLVVKNDSQPHFQIIGVFLFPGKEIPEEYTDTSGTQSFDFIRIDDWQTAEAKKFVKLVWDWNEKEDMIYHGVNYGKCTGQGETFV